MSKFILPLLILNKLRFRSKNQIMVAKNNKHKMGKEHEIINNITIYTTATTTNPQA